MHNKVITKITTFLFYCFLNSCFVGCAVSRNSTPGLECVDRLGHCFYAEISGYPVTPLASEKLQLWLKMARQSASAVVESDLRRIQWEVTIPPGSEHYELRARPNAKGESWFGNNFAAQLEIAPLVYAEKEPRGPKELRAGLYLVKISAQGSNNWDRKYVFLHVSSAASMTPEMNQPNMAEGRNSTTQQASQRDSSKLMLSDFAGKWRDVSTVELLNGILTVTLSIETSGACTYDEQVVAKDTKQEIVRTVTKGTCSYNDGYLSYRGTDDSGKRAVGRFKVNFFDGMRFVGLGADNNTYNFSKIK